MKKILTLKKNYEFNRVFSRGKYINGEFLCIYLIKNKFQKNRVGIVVSKKTAKSVKRNRIKRLIRENYRLVKDKLEIGYDILIVWKKSKEITLATYKNIEKDMKKIFKKANMI